VFMRIEQALYGGQDSGGYHFQGRSPGFRDDWLADAERLCTGFGERPVGVACPLAVFALPLNAGQVAVVQAADQGRDDTGRPGALAFRLLVLPRRLYADLGGDPFHIADQYPPPWEARGELPALDWTAGPPSHRTVDQVRSVLDVPHSATLLGGVQALLDGSKLVFERPAPDERPVRDLWKLLPASSRSELWPASFAFDNVHGFHALVVPRAHVPGFEGYLFEEQMGDYPEGNYEHSLQVAAENRDQDALDTLFARRSRSQMIRLGLLLLGAFAVAAVFLARSPEPPPPTGGSAKETAPREKDRGGEKLRLPPAETVPTLQADDRARLVQRLRQLGTRLGCDLPPGHSPRVLTEMIADLDARIDKLSPARRRDPGKLADLGPVQLQLRALLWKRGVADYAEPGLQPLEMVERLEDQLKRDGVLKE
jgi:hypothetical protein